MKATCFKEGNRSVYHKTLDTPLAFFIDPKSEEWKIATYYLRHFGYYIVDGTLDDHRRYNGI